MKILNYKLFSESYDIENGESPEMASDKNLYNNNEKFITEFSSKKSVISNIYSTYKDDKELISKLKNQKLISDKSSDPKSIVFINPLLGIWAQSCSKLREVKNIQSRLEQSTLQLNDANSSLSQNPENRESIQDNIKKINASILELRKNLETLNKESQNLQKEASQKLQYMKKDIDNSKKRIDQFQSISKLK